MTNDNNGRVTHSNQLWVIDRIKLNISVKVANHQVRNPFLDVVIDLYSQGIAGYQLNVSSNTSILTALRHAVLPKNSQVQYETHCEWDIHGNPEGIVIDRMIDLDSSSLDQIAHQLGCQFHQCMSPSWSGSVERFYNAFNRTLSVLPGYRETPQKPPVNHEAYLELQQLEQIVGHYIIDNYNQQPYLKTSHQTRSQRWKEGLVN